MKDVLMLMGFSMGLVTGALLYKYSQTTKQMVDKSEKAVMNELENMKKTAQKQVKKATQK